MLMRRTRNNATFGYNKLYTHTQWLESFIWVENVLTNSFFGTHY